MDLNSKLSELKRHVDAASVDRLELSPALRQVFAECRVTNIRGAIQALDALPFAPERLKGFREEFRGAVVKFTGQTAVNVFAGTPP